MRGGERSRDPLFEWESRHGCSHGKAGQLNGDIDSVPLTRIEYSKEERLCSIGHPGNCSGISQR